MNQINLELLNLNLSYEDNVIFSNLDFNFEKPGIFILSGPSGIGKSTLLKVIAGFDEQKLLRKGEIKLNGVKYTQPSRKIFYVQQEDELFDWMTISGHLKYFVELGAKSSLCDELLEKFELKNASHLYPSQISFGMKRRLALLRAMVFQPDVLLLDETLSSLDSQLRISTLAVIEEFVETHQKICIIVTHYPNDFNVSKKSTFLKLNNSQLVFS